MRRVRGQPGTPPPVRTTTTSDFRHPAHAQEEAKQLFDNNNGLFDYKDQYLATNEGTSTMSTMAEKLLSYGSMTVDVDLLLKRGNKNIVDAKAGVDEEDTYLVGRERVLKMLDAEFKDGSGDLVMTIDCEALNNCFADAPPFAFAIGVMRSGAVPQIATEQSRLQKLSPELAGGALSKEDAAIVEAFRHTSATTAPVRIMTIPIFPKVPKAAKFGPSEVLFWGGPNQARLLAIAKKAKEPGALLVSSFRATCLMLDIRKKLDELVGATGGKLSVVCDAGVAYDIGHTYAMLAQFRGALMRLGYRELTLLHNQAEPVKVCFAPCVTTQHRAVDDPIKAAEKKLLQLSKNGPADAKAFNEIALAKHGGQSAIEARVAKLIAHELLGVEHTHDPEDDVKEHLMRHNLATSQSPELVAFLALLARLHAPHVRAQMAAAAAKK
jgi:hypothetical protein